MVEIRGRTEHSILIRTTFLGIKTGCDKEDVNYPFIWSTSNIVQRDRTPDRGKGNIGI